MKRLITLGLVLGLVMASIGTAQAARSAKPVATTLYFHGTETVGEVDLANNFGVSYNQMTPTKPSDAAPKSLEFTTWAGTPSVWNDCAASYLLPVWTGPMSGRVVGDIKVTLETAAAPRSVTVQLWPDLGTQTCASNDVSQGQYPQPVAQRTVDLPPGPGESVVTLKHVNFKVSSFLTLQLLPQGPIPGRVLYDSPDFASRIQLTCIPASGKTCTP